MLEPSLYLHASNKDDLYVQFTIQCMLWCRAWYVIHILVQGTPSNACYRAQHDMSCIAVPVWPPTVDVAFEGRYLFLSADTHSHTNKGGIVGLQEKQ